MKSYKEYENITIGCGRAASIYAYSENEDDYVEVDDEILSKIDDLRWNGLDADEIAQRVHDGVTA